MARLRGPEGCPWDRAQNYDSVKGLLLEEAYEVVDAVAARDFAALEEELGDLLFQVVFYSRLAEEEHRFSIAGVIDRLYAKLVRRHPHVFGETRARTPEEALASWNAVKEQERETAAATPGRPDQSTKPPDSPDLKEPASLLTGIPASMPATLVAHELGLRAAEAGFDWAKAEDLLDKIAEEVAELRRELAAKRDGSGHRVEEEAGDLLFAATNLARYVGSDAESALRRANQKFTRRFQALEQVVAARGKKVRECSAGELDEVWSEVKKLGH